MDIILAVEELALSGGISLGRRSRSTVYRWTKAINEYLETNKCEISYANEFDKYAVETYEKNFNTKDIKRIEKITNIKVDNKNFYNFLITKLDINDKYDVEEYENVIDDFILPVICNKLAKVTKINDDKEMKIYIKLDDDVYADHIKKLRKLSLAKKIRIKE